MENKQQIQASSKYLLDTKEIIDLTDEDVGKQIELEC